MSHSLFIVHCVTLLPWSVCVALIDSEWTALPRCWFNLATF